MEIEVESYDTMRFKVIFDFDEDQSDQLAFLDWWYNFGRCEFEEFLENDKK